MNFTLEKDSIISWSKEKDFDIKENIETTKYLSHTEMDTELEKLANENKAIMEYKIIEKTPKGNSIPLVHLSSNLTNHEAGKPHVLLIGGLHGNETVGAELLMRFVRHQITGLLLLKPLGHQVIQVYFILLIDSFDISDKGPHQTFLFLIV